MEQIGGEREGRRASLREVIWASVVGTVIEWYDFFIYGAAAAVVFNKLFFPQFAPLAGTMAAFGTYAVGFFARPVGGIIFGNYGDRIGRKAMLVITLMLMGVATTLMGLLPTYETIGIWAPILLLLLRILQGLGAGAEFGGAVVMAAEYSPVGRRGFYASLPCTGVAIGLLLSSGAFALFSSLPEEQFLSWGWRIPFLLSVFILGVGLYVRLRILETPVFEEVKETHTEVEVPVKEVVRTQPRNLLVAIGALLRERELVPLQHLRAHLHHRAIGPAGERGLVRRPDRLRPWAFDYPGLRGTLGPRRPAAGVPGGLGVRGFVRLPLLLDAQHQVDYLDLAGHHPEYLRGHIRDVLPAGGLLRGALRHPRALQRDRARP
jgi:MFS family permease